MSMYVKKLDAQFNHDDLDFVRSSVLAFHFKYRDEFINMYSSGTTIHAPALGYYLPQYNITHTARNVSAWEEFNEAKMGEIDVHSIKMKYTDTIYQNLYVIKSQELLTKEYTDALERIINKVPSMFDNKSASITVQELGYSMKFHTDAGVESRIHVNLNRDSLDYFYTEDGPHRWSFGECCLVEASKTYHGFMAFQKEPRIHLILDVV